MVRDSLSSSLGGMMITGITIIIIIIGKEMATMKEGINTLKSMLKIVDIFIEETYDFMKF